jgi:hypothetical protein
MVGSSKAEEWYFTPLGYGRDLLHSQLGVGGLLVDLG